MQNSTKKSLFSDLLSVLLVIAVTFALVLCFSSCKSTEKTENQSRTSFLAMGLVSDSITNRHMEMETMRNWTIAPLTKEATLTLTDSALALLPTSASYVSADTAMTIMVMRVDNGYAVKAISNTATCEESTRYRVSQADSTQRTQITANIELTDEAASSDIKRNRGHPEVTASIAVAIAAIVGWVIKKKLA